MGRGSLPPGDGGNWPAEGGDLTACAHDAWSQVWGNKSLLRAFTVDYESTVPAQFSKDGKCHCYLYIAVK